MTINNLYVNIRTLEFVLRTLNKQSMEDKSVKIIHQNNVIIALGLSVLVILTSAVGYYLTLEVRHAVERTFMISKEIGSIHKEIFEVSSRLNNHIAHKTNRESVLDSNRAANRAKMAEVLIILKRLESSARSENKSSADSGGNLFSTKTVNNNSMVSVQKKG